MTQQTESYHLIHTHSPTVSHKSQAATENYTVIKLITQFAIHIQLHLVLQALHINFHHPCDVAYE